MAELTTQTQYKIQVDKSAYVFKSYAKLDRWSSYFYQIKEVLGLRPASVLEIGVGDRSFGAYLKNNTPIEYKSLDFAAELKPDIVADVNAIPLPNKSFEAVCAFEVLEHLPFERFEPVVTELARVSSKYVVISLPHFGPTLRAAFKIPFLPELHLFLKIPLPLTHKFNGEHYWELGKRGYPVSKIRKILEKQFVIKNDFIPFENHYHHFFTLEKKV
jgi:ubiquinone/menaquinone biosynthesis C-methylase UbiE